MIGAAELSRNRKGSPRSCQTFRGIAKLFLYLPLSLSLSLCSYPLNMHHRNRSRVVGGKAFAFAKLQPLALVCKRGRREEEGEDCQIQSISSKCSITLHIFQSKIDSDFKYDITVREKGRVKGNENERKKEWSQSNLLCLAYWNSDMVDFWLVQVSP